MGTAEPGTHRVPDCPRICGKEQLEAFHHLRVFPRRAGCEAGVRQPRGPRESVVAASQTVPRGPGSSCGGCDLGHLLEVLATQHSLTPFS